MPTNAELDFAIALISDKILRPVSIKKEYAVIGKRFSGGAMGGVYPVKRRRDKKLMIGKMITNDKKFPERLIRNEIQIMLLNKGQFLVECYDSLQYKP